MQSAADNPAEDGADAPKNEEVQNEGGNPRTDVPSQDDDKENVAPSASPSPQTAVHDSSQTPLDPNQLKTKLDALFCHFTWKPEQVDPAYPHDEIVKCLQEDMDSFDLATFNPIMNLCHLLDLAYAHAVDEDYSKAMEVFADCSQALVDPALNNQREGFRYVFLCDQAHVNFLLKDYELVGKLLTVVRPYTELYEVHEAAVHAAAGHCHLHFGSLGFPKAVIHFQKAVNLDRVNPEWHFLLGKVLARIRRIDARGQLPSLAEIEHLEAAVKYGNLPGYKLLLAQSLQEKSSALYRLHGGSREYQREMKQLNARAHKLFSEALAENPDCSKTNVRCGRGFMKLPRPFKDVALAEKCFMTAVRISPDNNMVLHTVGNFYERQKKDLRKAKECYEKCVATASGNYGAELDLLRIKYMFDSELDPLPDFNRIVDRYPTLPRQLETFAQMGSYFYLHKHDLQNAEQYYSKAIQLNPNAEVLSCSQPMFRPSEKVNVHETVRDILKQLLNQTTDSEKEKTYRERLSAVEEFLSARRRRVTNQ